MFKNLVLFVMVLMVWATTAPLPAFAQKQGPPDDFVVATVNGDKILFSDVRSAIANQSPQTQKLPLNRLFPMAINQLVTFKLLTKQAYAQDLDQDQEVLQYLKDEKEKLMQMVYLKRAVEARITVKMLKKAYKDFKKNNPRKDEIRARNILLESLTDAEKVIADLGKGADFAALAKTRSTGPYAPKGGDLGYFTADMMLGAIPKMAFAMEIGEHSQTPTKTQHGWHVIKIEDRRKKEHPSFKAMKERLQASLSQGLAEDVIKELRKDAVIELYDAKGNIIEPDKAPSTE